MSSENGHQSGDDGNGGIRISIPTKRKKSIVLWLPAGLLLGLVAGGSAWLSRDHGGEKLEPAAPCACPVSENEFKTLRTQVDGLMAKEAERERRKEIDAAVEARLTELANKVGPGRVKP